jgi:hypothetical protein
VTVTSDNPKAFPVQTGSVPVLSVVPVTARFGGASVTVHIFVIQPL